MSLSWGRPPAEDRGPGTRSWLARLALVTIVASLAAMGTPGLGRQPSAVRYDTRDLLTGTLALHRIALEEANLERYRATIDPTRGRDVFRRCMDELFRVGERRSRQLGPMRVARIEAYGQRYARAYVEERDGLTRYYFHYAGYSYIFTLPPWELQRHAWRWYLTEPLVGELGEQRERAVEGIKIHYWEIDEDHADLVAREAAAARAFALGHAPVAISGTFDVWLHPARSVSPGPCLASGQYDASAEAVRVFRVWFTPDLRGLAPATHQTLQHEALHWIQDRTLPGIYRRADWWLAEGWPDHLAGTDRRETFRRAGCQPYGLPTMRGLSRGPEVDPEPDPLGRYFAFAQTVAEYLLERYGTATYWKLLEGFSIAPLRGADGHEAAQSEIYLRVLGISPDQFRDDWAAWVTARYCT